MKFQAPDHVTGIHACGFEIRADSKGVAELPDDAPVALTNAMFAAGWREISPPASAPAQPLELTKDDEAPAQPKK